MLAHRLRRWPSISPPLDQSLTFPGQYKWSRFTQINDPQGQTFTTAQQRQTAVAAYFSSKQLLLFAFLGTNSYCCPVVVVHNDSDSGVGEGDVAQW